MPDWIKLHTDLLDNPDLSEISAEDYRTFTFLLMLARREDCTDGVLAGWTARRLAFRFRQAEDQIAGSLATLQAVGWVECTPQSVTITNYVSRQYDNPSDQPAAARDRQAKHRDAARRHDIVTTESRPGHETEERRLEETRSEERRGEETAARIPPPAPPPVESPEEGTRNARDGHDPAFGELWKLLTREHIVVSLSDVLRDDVQQLWSQCQDGRVWREAVTRAKARDPTGANWALVKRIMADYMRCGSFDRPDASERIGVHCDPVHRDRRGPEPRSRLAPPARILRDADGNPVPLLALLGMADGAPVSGAGGKPGGARS
jgi:hypothetical protein